MAPKQHQIIIDRLQNIIADTIRLMDQFEEKDMVEPMAEDYEKLHTILTKAIQKQRKHIRAQIESEKLE